MTQIFIQRRVFYYPLGGRYRLYVKADVLRKPLGLRNEEIRVSFEGVNPNAMRFDNIDNIRAVYEQVQDARSEALAVSKGL